MERERRKGELRRSAIGVYVGRYTYEYNYEGGRGDQSKKKVEKQGSSKHIPVQPYILLRKQITVLVGVSVNVAMIFQQ